MRALWVAAAAASALSVAIAPAAADGGAQGRPLSPDGFVRDWLVLEPAVYQPAWPPGRETLDRGPLANEARPRAKAGDRATVAGAAFTWKAHRAADGAPGIDLAAALGTDPAAATMMGYVLAYVVAPAAAPRALLSIGVKDLAAVYWNGRRVLRWDRHRAFAPDQSAAEVAVERGVNVLVVKALNGHGGPWAVAARLLDEAGRPVPGLRTALSPDGAQTPSAPDAAGYLREVLVLGPMRYRHRPLADGQLDAAHLTDEPRVEPVAGRKQWLGGHGVVWRAHHSDGPVVDFNAIARAHQAVVGPAQLEAHDGVLINGVTWAATYLESARDRTDVRLELGANDLAKVLVNGREVIRQAEPGGLDRPRLRARITLRKGPNLIALKTLNAAGKWQTTVGLFDGSGAPLTDVTVHLAPPVPRLAR